MYSSLENPCFNPTCYTNIQKQRAFCIAISTGCTGCPLMLISSHWAAWIPFLAASTWSTLRTSLERCQRDLSTWPLQITSHTFCEGKKCKLFEDSKTTANAGCLFSPQNLTPAANSSGIIRAGAFLERWLHWHSWNMHQKTAGIFVPESTTQSPCWSGLSPWSLSEPHLPPRPGEVIFRETSCDNFYNSCPWNSQTSMEFYENTYAIHDTCVYIRYCDCMHRRHHHDRD